MNPKKIILILLFILALQFVLGTEVLADTIDYDPLVDIPGYSDIGGDGVGPPRSITITGNFDALKGYISGIYRFGMAITGILAVIVLALGGITWLTSGGNANQIGKAKQYIWGSMTGLVLALLSYTLLNLVNPEIVKLTTTEEISALQAVKKGCGWQKTECDKNLQVRNEAKDKCGNKPKKNSKEDNAYTYCCCSIEDHSGCCVKKEKKSKVVVECNGKKNKEACDRWDFFESDTGIEKHTRDFYPDKTCDEIDDCQGKEGVSSCLPEYDFYEPLELCKMPNGSDGRCWGGKCIDNCSTVNKPCKEKNSLMCCAGAAYCKFNGVDQHFCSNSK